MNFWRTILRLLRRKSVVLPVVSLALALGCLGYAITPTQYVSDTTMVLTTPAFGGTLSQDPSRPNGLTNPLLNFDNGLKVTSAILIQAMNTPEVAVELGTADGPTKLTIDDGSANVNLLGSNGPWVYILGQSTSAKGAQDVVIKAQRKIRGELVKRQQALHAPPGTFITLVDVVKPSAPEAAVAGRVKTGAIAFIVSLLLGVGVAYGWQVMRETRARRSRNAIAGSEVPPQESIARAGDQRKAQHRGGRHAGRAGTTSDVSSDSEQRAKPPHEFAVPAANRDNLVGELPTRRDRRSPGSFGMRRPEPLVTKTLNGKANGVPDRSRPEEVHGHLADR